ncbi:MAG: hypothetical protein CMJ86_01260 [Planctomycetes bacterium]|nr:hypothetical protein [Planctomycetota bacterium]
MIKTTSLLVLMVATGCNAQRYPSPMGGPDTLPPGFTDLLLEGPEEALLVRHADTVHVKRAGQTSIHSLHFYDRQARIHAGAAVFTDAGGRAELVFPQGSRASMHGNGVLVLGSPSRGEPMVSFLQIVRATVDMGAGEVVRLPGGSHLLGDGGPFYLELIAAEVLELRHRGSSEATLAFADERIVLTPGDVLHLPVMGNWSAPSIHDPDHVLAGKVGPVPLVVGPGVVTDRDPAGVVSADMLKGQQLRALGVQLHVSADQHVRLSDLANVSPSVTTEAAAVKAD